MTTTATEPGLAPHRRVSPRPQALVGTLILARFFLRRDRVKLPAWILGIALMGLYYGSALPQIYQTEDDLRAVSQFGRGVVGALISGPGYGLADPSVESLIVAIYGLYFLLLAALMNILLVSRHTRVEEQNGRAELVRADVVGRHAQLTAALLVAVVADLILALAVAGSIAAAGLATYDALLFGASVGMAGLVFAAVTAVTVQITAYSRAATGLSGAILGLAYVLRAAGDAMREGGSALSWLSPLAWSQQTRAYADGRWWPLGLSVVFVAVTVAVAYVLSTRRDLGAGLVPPRPGSPRAPRWLGSPSALAFRLQRAGLIGWGCALIASSALYGGIGNSIVESFEDLPDQLVEVMGGDASRMLDGYVGTMALFDALLITVFVILGVGGLRGEETRGRADPVLATAVGRRAWYFANIGVTALGAVLLLLVTGLVFGLSTALSVGDGSYVWAATAAHLVYLPAVLVVLALAALLYGVAPRAIGATWALLGFALVLGFFGAIMDLPGWIHDLSPFEHIARLPMDTVRWPALVWLTVFAAAAVALGFLGFRRRDVDSK
ncbi:ABC transporter permease [Nocardia mangyaensis]|uniref:ABC transporter permease n=1 Tax=Nocardia mangyaensis TaxID=2213200 RepID=UPI00267611B3|nr:ABC transporter permease [Nocardia mangyaensis]MDO3645841.1 ABC transporter permease [Nocardia mangyaensis]